MITTQPDALCNQLRTLLPPELSAGVLRSVNCSGFLTLAGLHRMVGFLSEESAGSPPGLPLLEVGAGGSHLGDYLSTKLHRPTIGLDKCLPRQSAWIGAREWPLAARLVADLHQIPLRAGCLSCVIGNDVFHLTATPRDALDECHRVLHDAGLLFFTTYTAKGAIPGGSRLLPDWCVVMRQSRFSSFEMRNVSSEWRRVMRIKHGNRLRHAKVLLAEFGEAARAELSVSVAMLGLQGPAFLDLVERWEVMARP